MAETTWTNGVGDGDASNDGNWSGVKPAAGDTAICDETSVDSITSGLDFDGVDLAAWKTARGYSGNIGASGSPLVIAADLVEHYGSGSFYYKNGNSGGKQTDLFRVDSDNMTLAAQIDDKINQVVCIKGRVDAAATADVGSYNVSYRSNPLADVFLTIAATADVPVLFQAGGIVYCSAPLTSDVNQLAVGTLYMLGSASADALNMHSGRLFWKSTAGITTRLICMGGVADFSQNLTSKTIAELHEFPDAKVILGDHVTVTTYNKVNSREPIC